MNQTQIDNLITFLWDQYHSDSPDVNIIITDLLNDLKLQLEGMMD